MLLTLHLTEEAKLNLAKQKDKFLNGGTGSDQILSHNKICDSNVWFQFLLVRWRCNNKSHGVGLRNIHLPHGCLQKQTVDPWHLGPVLVWYVNSYYLLFYIVCNVWSEPLLWYFSSIHSRICEIPPKKRPYNINKTENFNMLPLFLFFFLRVHFCCQVTYLFQISAMVPEYWLTEGGQSATGALLDYIVESHLAGPLVANRAASQSMLPLH